jgi:hypothetical protein
VAVVVRVCCSRWAACPPPRQTSSYKGVTWNASAWTAQLYNPQTKRQNRIGSYASEEDAARAYDCAAMKLHGPGYAKRNFPGELISEPPGSLADKRRRLKSSRFNGVSWHKTKEAWVGPAGKGPEDYNRLIDYIDYNRLPYLKGAFPGARKPNCFIRLQKGKTIVYSVAGVIFRRFSSF